MTDPIRRIAVWLRLVFGSGSGRRRADARRSAGTPARRRLRGQVVHFGPGWGWTARPRPPYGLRETLDSDAVALVLPYPLTHERRRERLRQQQRCLALVMAAHFGIDLDRRVLHGTGAAR
ncbi:MULTISPECIES: hypothetical protein [unclassified Streptomyces]|uniref:hypothetical protein n=1 Tax=unclassified Streptomyces TaxID=2593676 RepID=UPI0008DCA4CB|nr:MULTISPECIES: hypothetical protein [unclassified Streptomyces]OII68621.1 hypothetical protein BJP39_05160 [Streptomyces sp. CC77]